MIICKETFDVSAIKLPMLMEFDNGVQNFIILADNCGGNHYCGSILCNRGGVGIGGYSSFSKEYCKPFKGTLTLSNGTE